MLATTTAGGTAAQPESFLSDLTYDDYKLIQFLPRRARWQGKDSRFRLHAFHMGWLFEATRERCSKWRRAKRAS